MIVTAPTGERGLGRGQVGVLLGPVLAVPVRVVEELGQALEQLGVPEAVGAAASSAIVQAMRAESRSWNVPKSPARATSISCSRRDPRLVRAA